MQDWKMTNKVAGLENAGLENDGQICKFARVENAGLEIDGQKLQGWKMTDIVLKDS